MLNNQHSYKVPENLLDNLLQQFQLLISEDQSDEENQFKSSIANAFSRFEHTEAQVCVKNNAVVRIDKPKAVLIKDIQKAIEGSQ